MHFQEQGSVNDRSRHGQGQSVCAPENTEDVRHSIEENPTTPTQRHSQKLAISWSSLQCIQRDLHMYPYSPYLSQNKFPHSKLCNKKEKNKNTYLRNSCFIFKL